jgi:hypothetical protein
MNAPDPLDELLAQIDRTALEDLRDRYFDEIRDRQRRVRRINTLLSIADTDRADADEDAEPEVAAAVEPASLQNGHVLDRKTIDELLNQAQRPGLTEAILLTMGTNTRLEWDAELLLDHLKSRDWEPRGQTPKNSIAATLSRLRAEGKVARVRPGVYSLAPSERASTPVPAGLEEQQQLVGEEG